jgi:hypothetical protein
MGHGWTGVHICDQNQRIFWPDTFDQLYVMRSAKRLVSRGRCNATRCTADSSPSQRRCA